MGLGGLLSRDEVLGGLPAKRAATLLFLIESRTRYLAAARRREFDRFVTEEAAQDRENAFLDAFRPGRGKAREAKIQEIERFAGAWADLVPENPRIRAALAHALGEKYAFPAAAVPGTRGAVGFDEPAVREAFERLHGVPLDSVYKDVADARSRLRWLMARGGAKLESLPPFWTVFALTVTETVGIGLLALPIAFAGIGALPGLALLLLFGLVNIVTVASLAETVTRTGSVRYRGAYFGRIVDEYLGQAGSVMLSVAIAAICIVALIGFHIGLSTTLEQSVGLPAPVWMVALFLADLYFVTRESMNSTVASALVVGAVNLSLVAVLAMLAFTKFEPHNLSHVAMQGFGGHPWDPSVLGLIFGVVLVSYFGHMSVGNCGKVVLRRDPSGRSLFWGTVAAQAVAMVIYCVWVVAVNGAIPAATLTGHDGTVLAPLSDRAGSIVLVFGSIFAVLGMGMGSIHMSLGLFNIVRDWLPRRTHPTVVLTRRGGRLTLRPRHANPDDPSVVITYAGLVHDVAAVRLLARGATGLARRDVELSDRWDGADLAEAIPELAGRRFGLRLERVEATADWVRLRVETPWSIGVEGRLEDEGFDLTDLLEMTDDEGRVIRWLTRQGKATAPDLAAGTGLTERATADILRRQVGLGSVLAFDEGEATRYRIKTARRRGSTLPTHVWAALGEKTPAGEAKSGRSSFASGLVDLIGGERARFVIGLAPLVAVFLLAIWLRVSGRDSFTAVLNFGGVIAVPIFAGVFSSLLLAASRRRGDAVPDLVVNVLGHPAVLVGIYALFVAGIFLHGLVIWTDPLMRVGAIAIGLATVVTTGAILRHGALSPRVVITIRQDGGKVDEAEYAVVAAGRPLAMPIRFSYTDHEDELVTSSGTISSLTRLRVASFTLAAGLGHDLRVWAPRLNASGETESLPVVADLSEGGDNWKADLRDGGGQVLLPLDGQTSTLEIRMVEAEAPVDRVGRG